MLSALLSAGRPQGDRALSEAVRPHTRGMRLLGAGGAQEMGEEGCGHAVLHTLKSPVLFPLLDAALGCLYYRGDL